MELVDAGFMRLFVLLSFDLDRLENRSSFSVILSSTCIVHPGQCNFPDLLRRVEYIGPEYPEGNWNLESVSKR